MYVLINHSKWHLSDAAMNIDDPLVNRTVGWVYVIKLYAYAHEFKGVL